MGRYDATEEELLLLQDMRNRQLDREYGRYSTAELEQRLADVREAIQDELDGERWYNDYEADPYDMERREFEVENLEEELERRRSQKTRRFRTHL